MGTRELLNKVVVLSKYFEDLRGTLGSIICE